MTPASAGIYHFSYPYWVDRVLTGVLIIGFICAIIFAGGFAYLSYKYLHNTYSK